MRSIRSRSRSPQIGGFALAPVLIPLLASAAPEIIKGIYNYFKGDSKKGGSMRGMGVEDKRDELIKHFMNY